MATHKNIYWQSDGGIPRIGLKCSAAVHILVGYNQATLSDFAEMADELRKTFPQASNCEISGGKVFKSSTVYGHTIISWQGCIESKEYPGWRQSMIRDLDYWW